MGSTLARIGEDGRYQVVRELGEGGMATVFLGHDDKLHGPVAIKVLSPSYTRRESVRRRFREEARQQSRLRHTNGICEAASGCGRVDWGCAHGEGTFMPATHE